MMTPFDSYLVHTGIHGPWRALVGGSALLPLACGSLHHNTGIPLHPIPLPTSANEYWE